MEREQLPPAARIPEQYQANRAGDLQQGETAYIDIEEIIIDRQGQAWVLSTSTLPPDYDQPSDDRPIKIVRTAEGFEGDLSELDHFSLEFLSNDELDERLRKTREDYPGTEFLPIVKWVVNSQSSKPTVETSKPKPASKNQASRKSKKR